MIGSLTRNGLGVLALLTYCLCQNYGGGQPQYNQPQQYNPQQYNPQQQFNYNRPPPPQILSHKQALNHDGNFKYVFTAENGLAQGESIAPDGSRTGGYTYVDPNGKKISIKYSAGKEGFRILEGDHLPKAPQPIAPLPAPAAQGYVQQPYNSGGRQDDGQYRPELYEKQSYSPAAYQQQAYSAPAPQNIQSNNIENQRDYYDEPGKPHSFGSGYIFEFAG
ncbi:hypothetical protein WA026_005796 [Henosepilachna vigintioctopunctata]|uniref:Uncharacterized protein n=1 Tax=Henosepilachna vigintioctopunctata TaxID=420089 RepID=A0AAW1U256_9CUCU